jgi:hypothetical protein
MLSTIKTAFDAFILNVLPVFFTRTVDVKFGTAPPCLW